jgi:ATP-dependent helicase Lhr and Lhr-like helicase
MKRHEYLFESGGLLSLGQNAERVYGKRNFLELYAVFSSPVLYQVETAAGRALGSLEQNFVDQLVEGMSAFLLAGRAWLVEHVHHEDRVVRVREAPRGQKPSWGGFAPSLLGFEVGQRMKRILTDSAPIAYADEAAMRAIEERRKELGDTLRRPIAMQTDDGAVRWWTFAGGKINQTLKHAFEWSQDWSVKADNVELRISGAGVSDGAVREAIAKVASAAFWDEPETRSAILGRLPAYRLSKFQDALPDAFAVEMVGNYLLDVPRAQAFARSVL